MTAEFTVAVHALVYLLHKNTVVSSQELAENICTNPARVRKVMAKLHKAGLAQSSQGKGSGYHAMENSAEISLDAVRQALNELPISLDWHSGDVDKKCLIASGMGAVMDNLCARMNDSCRSMLAATTIGDINQMIFKKEE